MEDGVPVGEQPVVERRATPRKAPAKPRQPRPATSVSVADLIDPLMGSAQVEVVKPSRPAAKKKAAPRKPAVPKPVADAPTDELKVLDDFFAPEPIPYVLPKIVPGEPEPEPVPEVVADEPPKPKLKVAFKPQFLRATQATKKLVRSLQPVVLPRHRPRVRRVTRVVRHIDTWSVFKIAVLFNIFMYAVVLIAGVMLWRVALNTGTIENIERFFESFGWQTFELKGGEIYHNAWIIGLFGVVGMTGFAVLVATMFNLITDLVGGVRVTVLEEEVTAREPHVVTWPRLLRPATPPRSDPTGKPPTN